MTPIQTTDEFRKAVDLAIDTVRQELANHRTGKPSIGTVQQLISIQKTLEAIANQLRTGQIPAPPDRHQIVSGMIYAVIDSWDFRHPLSVDLAHVWKYYLHELS